MEAARVCPRCGTEFPGAPLHGLCPKCVARIGFASDSDSEADAPELIPEPAEIPLRTFGDYELIEEIARGGMGVVYKARQISLNRIVAVKMILTGQLASQSEVQRFHAEAEAVAGLQHPNIVAIHEVGDHEGQHYFSMDYIEGQNLAEWSAECKNRNAEWCRQTAGYVKTIAEAIHYAHEKGTLHRDLKPSNVLIDSFGQPRVTDFGLAKRLHRDPDLTATGQVLGTPNFMSPEQADGDSAALGPQSDLYSLGAILYFLLTGQPPFHGTSTREMMVQLVHHELAPARSINRDIPRDLETICEKCLRKRPERRYGSAKDLAEDLGRFLRNEPILARPVGSAEKLWRACRRRPAAVSFFLLTALLLLVPTIRWLFAKPTVPSLPVFSGEGGSGVIEGKLYVATGSDGMDGIHPHFHVCDLAKRRWHELQAPPIPHNGGAAAILDGKFYFAGGGDGKQTTGRLDVFDPATKEWTMKQSMTTPRTGCTGAGLQGRLFVVGGNSGTNVLATVEAYDFSRNAWSTEVPLPAPRTEPGATVLNGVLFVLGGRDRIDRADAMTEVWALDHEQHKWISKTPLREPRARAFVTAFNSGLFIAGGVHLGESPNSYFWNPSKDQWDPLPPMPSPSYGGDGARVIDGKIWCIGGWWIQKTSRGLPTDKIFIYDRTTDSWETSGATR